MKNDKKIEKIVKKIKACVDEFVVLPNQCAYTDSIVERMIGYSKELEKLTEEDFDES